MKEKNAEKVKIVLTCPNCNNSTWLRLNAGEFECLSCGDIYDTEDMCSEAEEFSN
jgi:ribosomal protein L37AE/L43A